MPGTLRLADHFGVAKPRHWGRDWASGSRPSSTSVLPSRPCRLGTQRSANDLLLWGPLLLPDTALGAPQLAPADPLNFQKTPASESLLIPTCL